MMMSLISREAEIIFAAVHSFRVLLVKIRLKILKCLHDLVAAVLDTTFFIISKSLCLIIQVHISDSRSLCSCNRFFPKVLPVGETRPPKSSGSRYVLFMRIGNDYLNQNSK